MVPVKRAKAILAGIILLTLTVSFIAYINAQQPPTPHMTQSIMPEIEEHHYINLIVTLPDNTTQKHTYETNSFVYINILFMRLFSTWSKIDATTYRANMPLSLALPVMGYANTGEYAFNWYIPYMFDTPIPFPASMVFIGQGTSPDGGQQLGLPLGRVSVPTVDYAYNDKWFNISISATFAFSESVTVREAMLGVKLGEFEESMWAFYASVIYDTFPAVNVPAGGSLTIQWIIAWLDHGAFTENWGKLWVYSLSFYRPGEDIIYFINDIHVAVYVPYPNMDNRTEMALQFAYGYNNWYFGRDSYHLYGEAGSMPAGYMYRGKAISVGGVATGAREVGLYWLTTDVNGNHQRILLARWVFNYTLPALTPVNIYITRGG
jgi:hypothetical protein